MWIVDRLRQGQKLNYQYASFHDREEEVLALKQGILMAPPPIFAFRARNANAQSAFLLCKGVRFFSSPRQGYKYVVQLPRWANSVSFSGVSSAHQPVAVLPISMLRDKVERRLQHTQLIAFARCAHRLFVCPLLPASSILCQMKNPSLQIQPDRRSSIVSY